MVLGNVQWVLQQSPSHQFITQINCYNNLDIVYI